MPSSCIPIDRQPLLPLWQRIFDLVIAGIAVIVLAPIMALVATLIATRMGVPVLFRQRRPGLLGAPFTMVKFRTMRNVAYSASDTSPDAGRITALGAFLRTTSLDELPELFCVLRGDMSLVGPRPLLAEYLPYYTEREMTRHLVRPGLTGLAQLAGRNSLAWESRLRLDVEFVERLSPALYFSIIWRTLLHLIRPRGIAVDSYAAVLPLHVERSHFPRKPVTACSQTTKPFGP
ncbi:MAG TPA: sugar transferase [Opitutaceae bacterium]|nr:sugar transferase [Opitutaceae bacterium]